MHQTLAQKRSDSLVFGVFSAIFLWFSKVYIGIERGKESLAFWVVFLGFYLSTKERKIGVVVS